MTTQTALYVYPGRPELLSVPGASRPLGPHLERINGLVLKNPIPPPREWEPVTPPPVGVAPPPVVTPPPPLASLAAARSARHLREAEQRHLAAALAADAVPTGDVLRARREALGLSQRDLARLVGMVRSHVGEIERDGRRHGGHLAYPKARLRLAAELDALEARATALRAADQAATEAVLAAGASARLGAIA